MAIQLQSNWDSQMKPLVRMSIARRLMLLVGITGAMPLAVATMIGYQGIRTVGNVAMEGAEQFVLVGGDIADAEQSEAKLDELSKRINVASHASLMPLVALGCMGMLMACVICFMVTRTLVQPIIGIATVLRAAEVGDYTQRVERCADDELGILASSINRLIERLEN